MKSTLNQNTLELIQGYADDIHCLELLRFFGKYSSARFNRLAIIHGLYDGSAHSIAHSLEKALKRVVEDNIINTSSENGITLYFLTRDKTCREMISEFTAIDSPRLQVILKEKPTVNKKQPVPDAAPNKSVNFPGTIILRPAGMGLR